MSVVVQKVDRPKDAVGQPMEPLAQLTLREFDQLVHDPPNGVGPVSFGYFQEPALRHVVGRDHGAEVQSDHGRQTGHGKDHVPDVVPHLATLDQLDRWNDHGLLDSFRRTRTPASGIHTPHVDLVGAGPDPHKQLSVNEYGRDDRDIRRVKGAFVRVVDDEHVTVLDARVIPAILQGVFDDLRH